MFKIQGKVVIKETGIGIPGLIVHAFDLDQTKKPSANNNTSTEELLDRFLPYDSLGSVITSKDGSFLINFDEGDFNVDGETDLRPEVFILVTRPEDEGEKFLTINERAIYVSRAIRYKAGKTESYHIRLLQATLDKFGIKYPQTDLSALGNQVSATHILNEIDQKAASKKKLNHGLKQIKEKITSRVDTDFASFELSKLNPDIRNSNNYFKPTDNLREKQTNIIGDKLNRLSVKGSQKTMKLRFTEAELIEMGLWESGRFVSGSIPSTTVKRFFETSSLRHEVFEPCINTFTEDNLTEFDSDRVAPAEVDTNGTNETTTISVNSEIQKQLATATSPETALRYEKVIDQNYKNNKVCETVNQLSLCGGPADVTSYHDFHSVQIAFEHVWTEIFDKDLVGLGKRLYEEVVKVEEGFEETRLETTDTTITSRNINITITPWGSIATPSETSIRTVGTRTISSIDDLSQLISELAPAAQNNIYLRDLVDELQQRLSEAYKFTIFAPNSVNYGVVFTFRQKWEPVNYQVGKLVSSLPLAPKEVRKYSSKRVITKSKNEKYLDDREFKGKSESTSTSRAESEIIKRATNNTSFGVNTHASVDMEMFEAGVETEFTNTSEKFSQDTKKNFREAVMNAVEEYRKQNKTEIEFGWKDEINTESSGEVSNPNDEITVTYLFYELQRQYDISEQLHKIQPVILVANEVPMPDEIDNDWLMAHAWILKRVILDESFIPIINQLTASSVGDNLAINNLKQLLDKQQNTVDEYNKQIRIKTNILEGLYNRIKEIAERPDVTTSMDIFSGLRAIFDPIGAALTNAASGDSGPTQAERINEYLQNSVERAEKESKELTAQLLREQNSLLQITEKYNEELQQYLDRQTAIMQLRIHVKENILYYMQTIWDYEPVDQRYFRLNNLDVNWFDADSDGGEPEFYTVRFEADSSFVPGAYTSGLYEIEVPLIPRIHSRVKRKLVEVADLDKLLGYKGNYMIFPVKENCYLHEFMIQEFIDNATGGIRDADDFANYKTQDLIDYLKCVRENNPVAFEREKDHVIAMINKRLQSPRKEKERIVIPTNSLFIEALPGKHPVMEDFKLAHRALDVKRVQSKVRHDELENLRLAARLMEGEREDPNIEKVVIKK